MELRSNESDTTSTELSNDTTDVSENSTVANENNNRKKMTQTLPIQAKKRENQCGLFLYCLS